MSIASLSRGSWISGLQPRKMTKMRMPVVSSSLLGEKLLRSRWHLLRLAFVWFTTIRPAFAQWAQTGRDAVTGLWPKDGIASLTVWLHEWHVRIQTRHQKQPNRMSYTGRLCRRHCEYQQIAEDGSSVRHIAFLAHHLRRASERHYELGFHCRSLDRHRRSRHLRLATVSASVTKKNNISTRYSQLTCKALAVNRIW